MSDLYKFIGTRPIICHNATFDSKFLIKEMSRIDKVIWNKFFCTLKLSRRLLLSAGSYKLSKLKIYIDYQSTSSHKDHRALSDVLVTVALWYIYI
jgi:DNA polymerase-3 subunit epsilon